MAGDYKGEQIDIRAKLKKNVFLKRILTIIWFLIFVGFEVLATVGRPPVQVDTRGVRRGRVCGYGC